MSGEARKTRSWPDWWTPPKMIPVTGLRDQSTRITYIPWSDVILGIMGWEMIPDVGSNVLIYFHPTIDRSRYEIRCHVAFSDPDPATDKLIGKFEIPDELFD